MLSPSYDRVKEYLVNMVGLPFSATEEDIRQFFYPIRMTEIEFLKNDRGLPRGIAVVGFYSEDDRENAMLRNKNTIGWLTPLGYDYCFCGLLQLYMNLNSEYCVLI